MILRIFWFYLILAGCVTNLEYWRFDGEKTIDLNMRDLLPIGRYKLYPCSVSKASGSFSVSYANAGIKYYSFCQKERRESPWAILNIKSASREICFYEDFEIEADTVIQTTNTTDCYSSPHEVIYLPLL